MNTLVCLLVVSAVGLANARPNFVYSYGAFPTTYQVIQPAVPAIKGVEPVKYIQYSAAPIQFAASPIQYAATPIQYAAAPAVPVTYAATPVKGVEPVHVVQYSSPIVRTSDESSIIQYITPDVSPIVKTSEAGHVVQYSSPIVPVAPNVHHKFHSQATDGSYSFGYSGGPSSRHEIRDQFGIVHGAYNYIDPKGEVQSAQYVADGLGFRVAATNLPVAPIANLESPKPVEETPEVKAARASHIESKRG